MKLTKKQKYIILCIFISPILAFISLTVYSYIEFYPVIGKIKYILNEADHFYKEPPIALSKIVLLAEGDNKIAIFVVKKLLFESGYGRPGLKWAARNLLWLKFLKLHFCDSEIFMLWYHFAPFEAGQGLNNSALYRYKRNINELDTEELATIVLIAQNPTLFNVNQESFKRRLSELLKKLVE